MLTIKVIKIDLKIIIFILQSKSVKHTVAHFLVYTTEAIKRERESERGLASHSNWISLFSARNPPPYHPFFRSQINADNKIVEDVTYQIFRSTYFFGIPKWSSFFRIEMNKLSWQRPKWVLLRAGKRPAIERQLKPVIRRPFGPRMRISGVFLTAEP